MLALILGIVVGAVLMYFFKPQVDALIQKFTE